MFKYIYILICMYICIYRRVCLCACLCLHVSAWRIFTPGRGPPGWAAPRGCGGCLGHCLAADPGGCRWRCGQDVPGKQGLKDIKRLDRRRTTHDKTCHFLTTFWVYNSFCLMVVVVRPIFSWGWCMDVHVELASGLAIPRKYEEAKVTVQGWNGFTYPRLAWPPKLTIIEK